MSSDPLVGQLLEGRYQVEALIGEGGMGRVYRALHVDLDAPRAIKVLRSELAKDAEFVARFEAEARVAEGLRHPNLVTVHDLGRLGDGTPYIVSELVEGQTLSELFRQGLTFTPEETCEWLCQLAAGLSLAHRRGIVHRDIAPDNIMVTGRGSDEVTVRLLDFGIAKRPLAKSGPDTGSSVFLGKLGYAAPEQMGALPEGEPLDGRTDVFSLTVVAYQMLTGKLPWKKDTLQAYVHDLLMRPEPIAMEAIRACVPSHWGDLIGAGLARDRDRRIPDMEALAAQFREAIATKDSAVLSPQQNRAQPAAGGPSGSRRLVGVAAAVAVLLALYWVGTRPAAPRARPTPLVADRVSPPPIAPTPPPSAASEQTPFEAEPADRATTSVAVEAPEPSPTPAPRSSTRVAQVTPTPSPSASTPPSLTRSPTPGPVPPPTAASAPAPADSGGASILPATLRITSNPEAEVQLNGVLLGRTPRSVPDMKPGPHELLLRTDDGRTHRERLQLAPGMAQSFDHRFPGYGSLSLGSATWAMVRVDDGPELETPVRIERLAAGDHIVQASRPGYQTRRIPITIEEGRSHTLVIDLERVR